MAYKTNLYVTQQTISSPYWFLVPSWGLEGLRILRLNCLTWYGAGQFSLLFPQGNDITAVL